jgi:hypothetical protein
MQHIEAVPAGDKAQRGGGAAAKAMASREAIQQRIAGETSNLQKRKDKRDAARKNAQESEERQPAYGAPAPGGRFAEAAAIANTLQPPSGDLSVSRARAVQLTPGSEQSYHMGAPGSYMDNILDAGATDASSSAVGALLFQVLLFYSPLFQF